MLPPSPLPIHHNNLKSSFIGVEVWTGGLMVRVLHSGLSGLGSSAGWGAVNASCSSLGKTLSLHPGVEGNPAMD